MKAKGLKVVLAAIFLTCVMVSTSFAISYSTATVTRAAAGDGGVVTLRLTWVAEGTCTGFTNRWFSSVATGIDDQTLAVALTAISLGKNLRIGIEGCSPGTFSAVALDN